MARYIVHYYVVNDVVTETPMGGADWIDKQFIEFHETFKHNKISKAVETFKKCVISEQARWKEFNRLNNGPDNDADVQVRYKDPRGVIKYYFEVTGLGYIMHGSPKCISRIWIEDTSNFKQKNSAEKRKQVEKQMSLNFSHDIWEKAWKNMNKKPTETFKEHIEEVRKFNEIPFT